MSTAVWKIDTAHSGVHFTVRHMVVATVRGQFRRFGGELSLDEHDPMTSFVSATIEAASIDTGNEQRDGELRSASFFDVAAFPTLAFASRRIERNGEGLRAIGDLTIKGVTREVALAAEIGGFVVDPWGGRRVGVSVRGSILRSDFGIVWNQVLEAGGVAVGDRIEIAIDIEAVAHVPARAVA